MRCARTSRMHRAPSKPKAQEAAPTAKRGGKTSAPHRRAFADAYRFSDENKSSMDTGVLAAPMGWPPN